MRLLPAGLILSLFALPLAAQEADLSAAFSIQGNRTPFAGDGVNVQLTVTNHGPDPATHIEARWTVPFSNFDWQIDRCTKTDNVLLCAAPELAPGASANFLIGVFVPADTRTSSASVSSSADDPNPANNAATFDLVPVFPDLQPILTVSGPPASGRPSAYGLSVENRGNDPVRDIHVRWSFEGDLTVNIATCRTIDAKTFDCVVSSLGPHQTSSPAFYAGITPGAPGGRIVSKAVVTYGDAPGPGSASLESVILPYPQLTVSVAPAAELDADGNLAVRYTVSNGSLSDATRLASQLSFPFGSKFVGASGADCSEGQQSVTCTMRDLPAGQSFDFTVTVRPPAPQGHFASTARLTWEDPALGFSTFATGSTILYHDVFVTTTDDGGAGSLRAAIDEIDAQCNVYNFPCRIRFRVAGPIEPLSPLPPVTPIEYVIDGGGTVTLRGARTAGDGLVLRGNATVKGMTIDGFAQNGIVVASGGATITGNTITGSGWRAISIEGGHVEVTKNVLARNTRSGIWDTGGYGMIKDNMIVDNHASGIYLGPHGGNVIISGNTISGNRDFGIALDTVASRVAVGVNSIHDNGVDAIDIGLDGPNDARAPHRPVITSASYDPATGDTTVIAVLDEPAKLVTLETVLFFANTGLDASGRAEAERFLNSSSVHGRTSVLRVHADLRGQYVTALDSATFDYFGEDFWTDVSELSDGVRVE